MKYVPLVKEKEMMILCVVLNVILSGSGTIVGVILAATDPKLKKNNSNGSMFLIMTLIGFLQFFLVIFFGFGYFFSLLWGYLMYQKHKYKLFTQPLLTN